ncbi:hypothetical protein C2S53_003007 [Perilla frutescens var. hirtella]|uniref:Polygalacturonase n=1 Tax=Perilla frutescens var. hirtella TaxID=608512 RepID=A0AAD4JFZ7_PERFH|nr:hypothetical protein C2S53_003007 [Perilla frutescens var. hirtella]
MTNREKIIEAKCIAALIFTLPLISAFYVANANPVIFDIRSYGAKPNQDISQALSKAWKDATASRNPSKIVIPAGKWMLSQAALKGPNLAPLELENQGIVQAYSNLNSMADNQGQWITIDYVNYFTLSGGVFDGQGQQAWKMNDCNTNKNCPKLPLNLSFNFITNSIIRDVTTKDSKSWHANCISSRNVSFTRFTVSAPGNSPNTDGIHVARSTMVSITDSMIGTGDDCISMGDELSQVHIRNVTCGPGHGISIGSLGRSTAEKDIRGIYVQNCTFVNTQNGVRIKTWPSAPATLRVSDLHFEDLIMKNAGNPVVFDQQYCPWHQCTLDKPSLIQISGVTINNVRGTTYSTRAVTLDCSWMKPCLDVHIGDINISYNGSRSTRGAFKTTCANVHPNFFGKQNPPIC